MKTLAIGSLFVLLAIVASVNAAPAFADHATAEVQNAIGSSTSGCQETNECFIPYEVTVDVGGEVTWSNPDVAAHTVTSGVITDDTKGTIFDSGLVAPGSTFSHEFEEVGTYPYFCFVHPWMEGVVIVQAVDDHGDDMNGDKDDDMMMNGDKDDDMMMNGDKDDDMMMNGDDSMMMGDMDDMMMPSSIDQIMATIVPDTEATKGSPMSIEVAITDLDGNALEHVNFKVTAMQGDQTIYESDLEHAHEGVGTVMTAPLQVDPADMPVDITVEFLGFGIDEITGPSGELATAQVVPEFGTIAVMILGISIVSIIAITAKSRVIPRI